MNPQTLAKIEALKAEIAKIEASASREELFTAVQRKVNDEELYTVAKGFTNFIEKERRVKQMNIAREARGKEEASEPPKQLGALTH